ncbi:MAG: hypothetical protein AAGH60_09850, partial [Pseudomonadota bacterium]
MSGLSLEQMRRIGSDRNRDNADALERHRRRKPDLVSATKKKLGINDTPAPQLKSPARTDKAQRHVGAAPAHDVQRFLQFAMLRYLGA